jgi:acetyl-CoA carboxylase biotin carboxyl carrier protein
MVDQSRPPAAPEAGALDPVVSRVRALLDLAVRHSLAELHIEAGDFKLSLRTRAMDSATGAREVPGTSASADDGASPTTAGADEDHIITAPMIGTFYVSPAPGESPFVNVGDAIEAGQTVAIIEAMKIMNEIQSDQAGVLIEVLARNGQGVEYGQPLFRLRTDVQDKAGESMRERGV